MRPATRALLILGSAAFLALSVAYARSPTGDPVTGTALALLSAGSLAVGLALAARQVEREPTIATVARDGVTEHCLLFSMSRVRLAVLGLVGSLWAAAFGIWASTDEPALRALLVALAAFFGTAGAVNAVSAFRGSYVALTPTGIYHRGRVLSTFVPWEAVRGVGSFTARMPLMYGMEGRGPVEIGVAVADVGAVLRSRLRVAAATSRRDQVGFDVAYPGHVLTTSPELLERAIRYLWEHPDARSSISVGVVTAIPPEDGAASDRT